MSKRLCVLAAALALVAVGCTSEDTVDVAAVDDAAELDATSPSSVETAPDDDPAGESSAGETAGDPATHSDEMDEHAETGASDGEDEAGEPPEGVDLVVPVKMVEFGYEFEPIVIPVGSTVRFDFVNDGLIEHEAMFGDMHQQEEFAAAGDHGEHEGDGEMGHHGDVAAITLGTGESGSLTMTFDETGEILIGCHLEGHWEAGMVAALQVA